MGTLWNIRIDSRAEVPAGDSSDRMLRDSPEFGDAALRAEMGPVCRRLGVLSNALFMVMRALSRSVVDW
jgi:hypothetical protein